jgi:hypothetical protein
VVSMAERFGEDAAVGDPRRSLERLVQELAERADELTTERRGGEGTS